jgi:vacuolar-type H+-ATPase subunit I/STV1
MDGRSAGWLLLLAGVVIILVGILMNLRIYFEPTSLFNTLLMLVLLFGGIGLIARSLKSL